MDLDIEKIAKALEGYEGKDNESGPTDDDIPETKKKGPSFMPDLLTGRQDGPSQPMKHKQSVLDTGSAISVVALLKRELSKINCSLKDYRIEFTVGGADINKISVSTPSIDELRSKVMDLPDDEKARITNRITAMALIAINDSFKEKLKQELGLQANLYEYENADIGAVSLTEAPPEQELQELPELPGMDMMGMPPPAGMTVEPDLEAAPEMAPAPLAGPGGEPPPPPPEAGMPGAPAPSDLGELPPEEEAQMPPQAPPPPPPPS